MPTSSSQQADRLMDTPQAARELDDVAPRLWYMDVLSIDVRVLYCTLSYRPVDVHYHL
jgi:hypothetical protein